MIGRHEVFKLGCRKQRFLHPIRSAHRLCLPCRNAAQGINNHSSANQDLRGRISTAC
jgi:hypothetical protein